MFVASTSEVYGKSSELPFREDGDIVLGATHRGRWAYACSKALDEFLALAYHRERMLPTVVGRMFNTVGPRQTGRYGMVVPTFVRQALANEPITVFGSGEQQHCFCHVHNVVRALAELPLRGELYGEVLNIGSTEEVSMLELAERVKRTTGSESEIVLVPTARRTGRASRTCPAGCPTRARSSERWGGGRRRRSMRSSVT